MIPSLSDGMPAGSRRLARRYGGGVHVRIVGVGLPARIWGDPRPGGCTYANIHVGVQRGTEVVDVVPGGSNEAGWDLTVDLKEPDGTPDFRGPYVHGKRGERFLYLSWGTVDHDGAFAMFRRAKLMLSGIDVEVVRAAARPGSRLVGRLTLTGRDGGPVCAAVRPPGIDWAAAPA